MLDLKDIENDVINFPYFGENIQDHVLCSMLKTNPKLVGKPGSLNNS